MRICSFLPSATEIVFALGLGDELVGVTHECDYPSEAQSKPVVISSAIDIKEYTSREIEELTSSYFKEGKSIYTVNTELLNELKPDIVITQELCSVCAVPTDETLKAIESLNPKPEVISLKPKNLGDIFNDILRVGEAVGKKPTAEKLVTSLRERVRRVESLVSGFKTRPRVFCMDWLDPPYSAGHWVPEIVKIAGGENGLGKIGEPSFKLSWKEIYDYAPDFIVVMPCGFDVNRTLEEIDAVTSLKEWGSLPAVKKGQIYLVDANSYFSRPGSRIVDGLEIMTKIIHQELFEIEVPQGSMLNLINLIRIESYLG